MKLWSNFQFETMSKLKISVLEEYAKDAPAEVFPFLFIGNFAYGMFDCLIDRYKWNHIISLTGDNTMERRFGKPFPSYVKSFTQYQIGDEPSADIQQYFDSTIDIIRKAREADERVYVHCVMGVSRSSSIVIAYLIKCHQMTFDEAWKFLREKRPRVFPNYGFQKQLRKLSEEQEKLVKNEAKEEPKEEGA